MALSRVNGFIGTADAGQAYDSAMKAQASYTAIFSNGDRWTFRARDMVTAQNDARFWADFTARELSVVIGN